VLTNGRRCTKFFLKLLFLVEKQKRNIVKGGKMKRNKKTNSPQLDNEEKMLLSSFENDEWKSVKNLKKEKVSARKTATKTLRKDVRINIRLASSDISAIKQIAAYEGLPYQTLIASVLHKYAAGHLR
jgi:predicted DNA binding CopG/RHH family protein